MSGFVSKVENLHYSDVIPNPAMVLGYKLRDWTSGRHAPVYSTSSTLAPAPAAAPSATTSTIPEYEAVLSQDDIRANIQKVVEADAILDRRIAELKAKDAAEALSKPQQDWGFASDDGGAIEKEVTFAAPKLVTSKTAAIRQVSKGLH